jgi:hypothetical protein
MKKATICIIAKPPLLIIDVYAFQGLAAEGDIGDAAFLKESMTSVYTLFLTTLIKNKMYFRLIATIAIAPVIHLIRTLNLPLFIMLAKALRSA